MAAGDCVAAGGWATLPAPPGGRYVDVFRNIFSDKKALSVLGCEPREGNELEKRER